ncbi:MAG: PRC-barrel domain-containing protein, partial [Candidatus Kerfeldbacteria bacterium]|nr:PRC-barrel domain-containing protein [Candidatus Kerfeldbacteria bacterium]
MRMSGSQLKHLPVVTVSGDRLGRVQDFEYDPETHTIETYIVSASRLVRPLQSAALRVHRSQVRSINAKQMVVDDGLKNDRA